MAGGVDIYNPITAQCAYGYDACGFTTFITRDDSPSRIDEASCTLYYLGWAKPDTLDSAAKWRIKKIEQVGNVWNQGWANGDLSFCNVWTNRGILPYS
jgi:hypothetical protein